MIAYTLTLCAALLPAQPDEAERLLREMDARITAANTLRIEFEVRSGSGEKGKLVMTGSLLIAGRNRFRYEVRYEGESGCGVLVSDGKRIAAVRGPGDKPEFLPLGGWDNDVLKSWLGRGGVPVSAFMVARGEKPGRDDGPQVSNRELLPDEEAAGGVKCRVVGYDLAWEKMSILDARVRLWIDPKTKLPLRREVAFRRSPIPSGPPHTGGAREGERFTALHTKFEIDPKLDDKLFELPKDPCPSLGGPPVVAYASTLPAFLLSVPAVEAELLLRGVEAKLAAAKTLRIEFTMTLRDGEVADAQGTLFVAEKNRVRLEFTGKDAKGRAESAVPTLSNGKELVQQVVSEREGKQLARSPTPRWYNAVLRSWLGRGGTFPAAIAVCNPRHISTGKKPGPADGPQTSNVRLLPDEKVNGVRARVVEYDLRWPSVPDEFRTWKARVWIDAKTRLPLRRTLVARAKPDVTATATETKFEFDVKLDDKLFALPK